MSDKCFSVATVSGNKSFASLNAAMEYAKEKAQADRRMYPAVVWDWERSVVVAVVTDDANGLTVHRLKTYPE